MGKKYIFVTGGVCSSLGKGIAASSLGGLLETRGLKVRMVKIDPYLNLDAGTMSPYQHGEVYVTDDGAETDLDLGNYARFTNSPLSQANSITTGQVYQEVIRKEREGRYLGRTVQVVPHITDEIKRRIFAVGKAPEVDITIVEVGGTVGDIESIPFLEAARQTIHDLGRNNVLSVHLALVPTVSGGELKTKPTQHAVKDVQAIGILPDVILCRASQVIDESLRKKISLFTNIDFDSVISAHDINTTLYEIPLVYHQQGLDEIVLRKLGIEAQPADISAWQKFVDTHKKATQTIKIAMVGKYIELQDAYKSVDEALYHGGIANGVRVKLVKVDSEKIKSMEDAKNIFKDVNGILVPGGFGERGVEGKILTARYARENKVPYFGICLGLQIMVIEYSRTILGYEDANSAEMAPDSKCLVVDLLEEQVDVTEYGGTMRRGLSLTHLVEGTIIHEAYGSTEIYERHRHRYEVSNRYKEQLQEAGLILAGFTPDGALVESVQWPDHPWGVGVQYHPEFTSKPIVPHPLFASFIKASIPVEKK